MIDTTENEEKNAQEPRKENRVEGIYQQIKDEIFNFILLPGDRFSETELSQRLNASRTPIREALFRLQREGYLEVHFRNGWQVKPFDFKYFEDLYDVRIILESAALHRLCTFPEWPETLLALADIWLVPVAERLSDGKTVSRLDEAYHHSLVKATGNNEMARMHLEITEHIRIIRRLDFYQPHRLTATYEEHAGILKHLLDRKPVEAVSLLENHIHQSRNEVRNITFHKIQTAREEARKPPLHGI